MHAVMFVLYAKSPQLIFFSAMIDAGCEVVKDSRRAVGQDLPGRELHQHARLATSWRSDHHTFDWGWVGHSHEFHL